MTASEQDQSAYYSMAEHSPGCTCSWVFPVLGGRRRRELHCPGWEDDYPVVASGLEDPEIGWMVNFEGFTYLVLAVSGVDCLVNRKQVVRIAPSPSKAQSQRRRSVLIGCVLMVEGQKSSLFWFEVGVKDIEYESERYKLEEVDFVCFAVFE